MTSITIMGMWMLLVLPLVSCELVMVVNQSPTERMTSLAVADNKAYVTTLDFSKERGQNGRVQWFDLNAPELTMHDFTLPAVSPISVRADECNRLWVLDSGVQNISGIQNKDLQPKLLIVNVTNPSIVLTYSFPRKILHSDSFLATFTVFVNGTCENTFAFIADFNRGALIVYSLDSNKSHVILHHYFNPDPLSNIPLEMIYNKRHRDVSGIFGLAVRSTEFLFHPLASRNEFVVSADSLTNPNRSLPYAEAQLLYTRPEEAGVTIFDKNNSVLFYAEFDGIGCMGASDVYTEVDMQPKGVVADISLHNSNLYVLTNGKNTAYVEKWSVNQLIKDTPCIKHYTNRFSPMDDDTHGTNGTYGEQSNGTPERKGLSVVTNIVSLFIIWSSLFH